MRFFGYFCDRTKLKVINRLSTVLLNLGGKSSEATFDNIESIGVTKANTTFIIES